MIEKRELIDMFKNIIFPKQAEDLLKINYEGLGELDKQEYLRDTSILIKLAEKGLKSEQETAKPYLDEIRERIELEKLGYPPSAGYYKAINKCLQIIDKYSIESEEK